MALHYESIDGMKDIANPEFVEIRVSKDKKTVQKKDVCLGRVK